MKLSEKEIDLVLTKIKTKYNDLINLFSKPKTILQSFEERYINVLKSKHDVSSFLLGEIQALEEFCNKEEEKKKIEEEKRAERLKHLKEKSFADKVMDENFRKIQKYPRISLNSNASEDIERLFGAARNFIINYYPVLTIIYRNEIQNSVKNILSNLYHNLIVKFDFKGNVPLAKNYLFYLSKVPIDNKKLESEYYFILKESAFLLNEIYDVLKKVFNENKVPNKEQKFSFNFSEYSSAFKDNFLNLSNADVFDKVYKYLENIIFDFRIKDIKKSK